MQATTISLFNKENVKRYIFDFIALAVIYFLPAFSHLFSFPLYLIEPMRIMVVMAMIYTDKRNAYVIAVTLPLFSFFLSGHPLIIKSFLILVELMMNVWLFFGLKEMIPNTFVRMLAAISGSKALYYILKIVVLSAGFMGGEIIATPVYMQIIVTIVLSGVIYFLTQRGDNVPEN